MQKFSNNRKLLSYKLAEMVGFFTGAVDAHSKLLLLESQTLTEPTEHTLVCTSHDRVATG